MTPFIDVHSHKVSCSDNTLSIPTLSMGEWLSGKRIDSPFWFGAHPCEEISEVVLLDTLNAVKDCVVGIGEIGLDSNCEWQGQGAIYSLQLDFAMLHNLPVTIHCVKRYNDIIASLKGLDASRVVMHSFVGGCEIASKLLDLGCSLSFGVTSLGSPRTVEVLRSLPHNRLFIESDDRCLIEDNYHKVAQLLGLDLDFLKDIIYSNYRCLIG